MLIDRELILHSDVVHPFFFFFNDTATTEIYTLSLHDALPISLPVLETIRLSSCGVELPMATLTRTCPGADRKSTRLNSSHSQISYAVFCLKKKKKPLRSHAPKALIGKTHRVTFV